MRHAVKPETHSRTIAAADVKQWFGRKAPSEAACSEIAERLTKMRWASDPQATFTPWVAEPDVDADRWWNFEAATSAAETLLAAFPRMLRHWDGLRWAPETSGGHPAIKAAQEALLAARPFIAAPFGPYERQDHRKRVRPADWHPPALAIKHILIQVLKRGGERAPHFSRDAAATRVVHEALAQMGYKTSRRGDTASETNTIATFLRRWEERAAKRVT